MVRCDGVQAFGPRARPLALDWHATIHKANWKLQVFLACQSQKARSGEQYLYTVKQSTGVCLAGMCKMCFALAKVASNMHK